METIHIWMLAIPFCLIFSLHCSASKVMLDMTYEYKENETAYWPTDYPRLSLQEVFVGDAGGYWLELYKFSTVDHAGTHIDAPRHFTKGGTTVDKIPIEKLVAPAVVIDISDKAKESPDVEVTVEDIQKWEETNGFIPENCVVLMNSGWGKWYSNKTAYYGSNDVKQLHFPGFHGDAAKWLIDNRDINGIGVDTPSLDFGQSKSLLSHKHMLNSNRFGLENLKNVDQVPKHGAMLYIMPMKIAGASGAPTRVIAMWDNDINNAIKLPAANYKLILIISLLIFPLLD